MAANPFSAIRRLGVWKDTEHVGTLEGDQAGRLRFTYLERVLHRPELAVSVRMPMRRKPWDDAEAMACFENLLPEGDIRTHLAQATHIASKDVSGLLGVIGGECAGALTLWPEGLEPPEPPQYAPCSAQSLGQLFTAANTQYAMLQRRTRQAMSGAQDKVVLLRRSNETGTDDYLLPLDGAPGTVICKRDRGTFPGLVHNEGCAHCHALREPARRQHLRNGALRPGDRKRRAHTATARRRWLPDDRPHLTRQVRRP